jgi:hypothetical protein
MVFLISCGKKKPVVFEQNNWIDVTSADNAYKIRVASSKFVVMSPGVSHTEVTFEVNNTSAKDVSFPSIHYLVHKINEQDHFRTELVPYLGNSLNVKPGETSKIIFVKQMPKTEFDEFKNDLFVRIRELKNDDKPIEIKLNPQL